MSAWGGARVQLLRPRLVLKDLVRLHLCQTFSQLFVCFFFLFFLFIGSARLGHRPRFTQNRTMTTNHPTAPKNNYRGECVERRAMTGRKRASTRRLRKKRKNKKKFASQMIPKKHRTEKRRTTRKIARKCRLEIYSVPVVAPPEGTLRRSTTIL